MNLHSVQKVQNKHTFILGLLVFTGIIIRVLWSFWGAREYWGDGYHTIWMIRQTLELGSYFDYKDRHLVWLPAYRFLVWLEYVLFHPHRANHLITPFILQLWYVWLSFRFAFKKLKLNVDVLSVSMLLFWPLPIVYGGLNMPEGLALCTITSIFYLAYGKTDLRSLVLIAILSAITMLSRHEATAFLGMYTLVLFFMGNRGKALSITLGVGLGILLLSSWNWMLSGDPLFWLTSKFNASSAGASDYIHSVGLLPRISEALFAVLLVFPSLVVLPFFSKKTFPALVRNNHFGLAPMFISTGLFLVLFLIGSLFFFHGADPKYVLIAAFPASLGTLFVFRSCDKLAQKTAIILLIVLVPLYLLLFHIRSFNLELERRLGEQLEQIIPQDFEGTLWCDFPTVLVYADWNPRQIISSDQVNREIATHRSDIILVLLDNNVEYIVSADYDHSSVYDLFPKMKKGAAFEVDAVAFTPIARIDAESELQKHDLPTLFPRLAEISLRVNKELVVWRVEEK